MSLELNNKCYNERSKSIFQEFLLQIREGFYENNIIKSILLACGGEKINGKVIDLGGGQGHKTKIISRNIIGENGNIYFIEPCDSMLEKAERKLKNDKKIIITKGSSLDLNNYKDMEIIFCNQMTHHLDKEWKYQLFKDAFKCLKPGGKIVYIC